MTQPTVSDTGLDFWIRLGPWQRNDASYVLLQMCESVVQSSLASLVDLSSDSDDGPGWSSLLDLDRCPDEYLPWLGQFIGVQTVSNNTPAENRDLITSRPSWKRGRPATLISAVQQGLTGTQVVVLEERDTSAYHATVHVYSGQVISEDFLLSAIAQAKPAGLIIDLDIRTSPTFDDIHTELGGVTTYAHRETRFPTYGDVEAFIP